MDAIKVPKNVAICPYCDGELWLEVTEWEEGGIPTETGCEIECDREYDERAVDHVFLASVYWLPVHVAVYDWAREHVRVPPKTEAEERDALKAWNAGEPLKGGVR